MKLVATVIALFAASLCGAAARSSYWGDSPYGDAEFERSEALCGKVRNLTPPAVDRPDAATAAKLKGCSSEALYYGLGQAADPVKARQCAFVEARKPHEVDAFWGEAMLMMIYANGRGAQRNLDLAIHYACSIDSAPAESNFRVNHLADLKAKNSKAEFDYCDDITSGLYGGFCSARDSQRAQTVRDARLSKLMATWTPAERSAFPALKKAYEAYAQAHSGNEVDLSGTARASMSIAAEDSVRDDFLDKLTKLSASQVPRLELKAEDAKLNSAYQKAMKTPEDELGTVKHADIRAAERVWLAYRDAFVAFARIKSPATPSDAVSAWLTQKRAKVLQDGDAEQ